MCMNKRVSVIAQWDRHRSQVEVQRMLPGVRRRVTPRSAGSFLELRGRAGVQRLVEKAGHGGHRPRNRPIAGGGWKREAVWLEGRRGGRGGWGWGGRGRRVEVVVVVGFKRGGGAKRRPADKIQVKSNRNTNKIFSTKKENSFYFVQVNCSMEVCELNRGCDPGWDKPLIPVFRFNTSEHVTLTQLVFCSLKQSDKFMYIVVVNDCWNGSQPYKRKLTGLINCFTGCSWLI